MLTFVFLHRAKDEILSNLIFKMKSNGTMFDLDFILKILQPKSEHIRGICMCVYIFMLCLDVFPDM